MHASTPPVMPASDRIAFGLEEVAARLGVTKRHVQRLIERGELHKVKVGRRSLVLATELDAYLKQAAA